MRLLLLRHAKSDWAEAGAIADHDRKLSARGRSAAPKIAAHIRAHGYEPAFVLCSTAARTRETLKLMLPAFSHSPGIRYAKALYLAEWQDLLAAIRKAPANASPLLLVGHNPGMEQLAMALLRQPKNAAEERNVRRLAQKFPTGALAVLDFEIAGWGGVREGRGCLIEIVRPKDLASAKRVGA